MDHVPSTDNAEPTGVASGNRLALTAMRAMVVAFALSGLAVAAATYHRTGRYNASVGGLLFNPADRFHDLTNTLDGIAVGNPYAPFTSSIGVFFPYGNVYPPAHVALLRPLNLLPTNTAITAVSLALVVGILLLVQIAVPTRHVLYSFGRGFSTFRPRGSHLIALSTIPLVLIVKSELDSYALVIALYAVAALGLAFAPFRFRYAPIQLSLTLTFSACYPVVFALDRMNVDIVVFLLLTLGVATALRRASIAPGLIIGAAAAFKLYPAALVLIVLVRIKRKTRFLVAAIAGAAVSTAVGIRMTGVAADQILVGYTEGLKWFEVTYALGPSGSNYTASLFNGIITWLYALDGAYPLAFAQELYTWWGPLQVGSILGVLAISIFCRYQDWAQWMLACTAIIAFVPATSEYRMVLLLIPIALWLRHLTAPSEQDLKRRFLHIALAALLGFSLAPKAIFAPVLGFITIDSLVTPGSIVALLLLTLALGWYTRRRAPRAR
jgi:hypothetical protein